MHLILLWFQQLWNFKNFERLYLKPSIMALEYFFHYSLQLSDFIEAIQRDPMKMQSLF